MQKLLKFKYSLGDKVKIVKDIPHQYKSYHYNDKYGRNGFPLDREYEISGYGWEQNGDGEYSTYYRLHAYCDDYLTYHNRVGEDYIETVGEAHPTTIETGYKSIDGSPVEIGDKVYFGIYYGNAEKHYISPFFAFAAYGKVLTLGGFCDGTKMANGTFKHYTSSANVRREYPCTFQDGTRCYDSRAYGTILNEYPQLFVKNIPENFVEKYVDAYFEHGCTWLEKGFGTQSFDIIRLLQHMGVYDQVIEEIVERRAEKKRRNLGKKKETKVSMKEMVKTLSPEQVEELKKLLNENK